MLQKHSAKLLVFPLKQIFLIQFRDIQFQSIPKAALAKMKTTEKETQAKTKYCL
jgi:hypothetical protein